MRKGMLIAAITTLAVAVPAAALALKAPPKSGLGALDEQFFRYANFASSTSSASFVNVPGLNGNTQCLRNGLTVQVSLVATGTPFNVQVRDTFGAAHSVFFPGPVTIRPGPDPTPVSFLFVLPGASNGPHTVDVQWRVLSPGTATIRKAAMNMQFQDCI
jgi:hypothetical protein